MFLVLWEFEVKPGNEERFEQVYGPGGDWDSLFRSDPGHMGTRLFRDTARTGVYLTADHWLSQKSYEEFLVLRRSKYKALDAASENLTLRERQIGSFETNANPINPPPTKPLSRRRQDRA
jgi:heme-degrading monooxygenase HmoA